MKIVRTVGELRSMLDESRRGGRKIGFVPTMGWFHDGHLSLMRRSKSECDITVVSLFVNPTQFNDPKDLTAYPRDEKRDADMAAGEGVDLLFAPEAQEIYPDGFQTVVSVGGVAEPLEGKSRGASHFAGVATVVSKLFNIVQPTLAYFGQKDAQQALVIRQMVRDLNVPVRVVVCPTIRESDGLAMSSRNVRLKPDERARALALRAGLETAATALRRGERRTATIEQLGRDAMQARGVEPEYFAAVSATSLASAERLSGEVLLAVAARVGDVRLIDNELVTVE